MNSMSLAEYKALLSGAVGARSASRATPEDDLHRACIEWVELSCLRHPILKWMKHTPNGGKRPKGEAGKLKAMGVKKGYPDIDLPLSHGAWKGLAIELKSPTGRVSPDQQEWLDRLAADGWLVGVARTLDEFIAITNQYLKGKK